MDNTQLTAILGVATAVGGAFVAFLRWCVNQWLKSKAEDRQDKAADRQTIIDNTKALVLFNDRTLMIATKIDSMLERLGRIGDFVEEQTNPHAVPLPVAKRPRTSPGGYRVNPRKDDEP